MGLAHPQHPRMTNPIQGSVSLLGPAASWNVLWMGAKSCSRTENSGKAAHDFRTSNILLVVYHFFHPPQKPIEGPNAAFQPPVDHREDPRTGCFFSPMMTRTRINDGAEKNDQKNRMQLDSGWFPMFFLLLEYHIISHNKYPIISYNIPGFSWSWSRKSQRFRGDYQQTALHGAQRPRVVPKILWTTGKEETTYRNEHPGNAFLASCGLYNIYI